MAALKCYECDLAWPSDVREYGKCPSCLQRTWWAPDTDTLDPQVALSMKRHYDFERFYIAREEQRAPAEIFAELERVLAVHVDDSVRSD
jgi:hypothetical protein